MVLRYNISMSCRVIRNIGRVPKTWSRDVIFFANILSLFFGNDAQKKELQRTVGNLSTYGSRLIPILNILYKRGKNILVLESKPDYALIEYFQNDLNLTVPKIMILPHQTYLSFQKNNYARLPPYAREIVALLKEAPQPWLSGYVVEKSLLTLAKNIGKKTISTAQGCRKGNDKVALFKFLKGAKLPVFDAYVIPHSRPLLEKARRLERMGYRYAVLKSPIGASGIGMKKIELSLLRKKVRCPKYLFYEGPALLEGWLDENVKGVRPIGSPSVQLFIDDKSVVLYDITEQILSADSVHEGNVAPPEYLKRKKKYLNEILRQAGKIGSWIYQKGYRGTASIDFQVVERNRQWEVRACEVNARVTGATYPSLLARKFLPRKAWLMRNIRFAPALKPETILKVLKRKKLLFTRIKKEGVLPFNFNRNHDGLIGKGQFLFLASNHAGIQKLLKRIKGIPHLKGTYDRD